MKDLGTALRSQTPQDGRSEKSSNEVVYAALRVVRGSWSFRAKGTGKIASTTSEQETSSNLCGRKSYL